MKTAIELKPNTFVSFKDLVAQTFPAWKVKQHTPFVYVNRTLAGAMLFSLTDYQFSENEIERLNDLAKQAIPAEVDPEFQYMPTSLTRVQVRKARTKMPAMHRKKIKAMADAFR